MYNPVNMKIEDQERLYERDLREKNKRKRFEVRYDVEAMNRKDGFSEQERSDLMRLNKVSHSRFKIEEERGFDIMTNDPLKGPGASKTVYQPRATQQRGVWSKAMNTVNAAFMSPEEIQAILKEEEQKKVQSHTDFHKTQFDKLKAMQTYDPLGQTTLERRSQRVMRMSQGPFKASEMPASSYGQAPPVEKQTA